MTGWKSTNQFDPTGGEAPVDEFLKRAPDEFEGLPEDDGGDCERAEGIKRQ
ncbi:MAG: hypothetical protein WCY70_00050 [Methanoculleus sp.]